jgi:hypothetical protein
MTDEFFTVSINGQDIVCITGLNGQTCHEVPPSEKTKFVVKWREDKKKVERLKHSLPTSCSHARTGEEKNFQN